MMNTFFLYILKCRDGSYYVGHTDNLEVRLVQHKLGLLPCYTRRRLPVELVYVESCETRDAVFRAERRVKGWSRKKKEALIREDWVEIVRLSNQKKLQSDPSTSSG